MHTHMHTQARSIITPCPVGPVSLIPPSGGEGGRGGGNLGGSASGLLLRGPYILLCPLEGEMSPGGAYWAGAGVARPDRGALPPLALLHVFQLINCISGLGVWSGDGPSVFWVERRSACECVARRRCYWWWLRGCRLEIHWFTRSWCLLGWPWAAQKSISQYSSIQ